MAVCLHAIMAALCLCIDETQFDIDIDICCRDILRFFTREMDFEASHPRDMFLCCVSCCFECSFTDSGQSFGFENFRVRSLRSINALNFWLGVCMTFLAFLKERSDSNLLYQECIEAAAPIKDEVHFFYYRLANGVGKILAKARKGIRGYFKPLRVNQAQLHIRGYRFA